MTDERIIELYFARDEQAIRETADRYGGVCMRVSMNILDSREDAEECVNDTYLKAWNSIPPQRPRFLQAFLCRITRNLSLNRYRDLRRARRNRDMEVAVSELGDCIPAPAEGANQSAEALGNMISEFLRAQNKTDRLLFMGRYWHACPVNELAKTLDMTPSAASVRLHRIRERLRAYLEERGYRI